MAAPGGAVRPAVAETPYEHRLALVTAVLRDRTTLDSSAARDTAVLVLQSIDTIPERIH